MSAATPALRALAGVEHRIHRWDHDPTVSSYGEEAVAALGVEPGRVLKTLVTEIDGRLQVAVLAVSGRLDLRALAAVVSAKRARLAERETVERVTGYVVGGVSPLGQRRRLPTVLDEAAVGWQTVFVSGGRRGLDLELAPADLVRLTAARVAPIARG